MKADLKKLEDAYTQAMIDLDDCNKAWHDAEDDGAVPGDPEYQVCSNAHRKAGDAYDRARFEYESAKAGAYDARMAMQAAIEEADSNRFERGL